MILNKYFIVGVFMVGSLVGCADSRIALAESEMQRIKLEDSSQIEPLPQPEKVEDFVYSASDVRSPFLQPSLLIIEAQAQQTESVRPNVNRPREMLEDYDLSELIYRGMIIDTTGKRHGLVQLPDGMIVDVKEGDYMGTSEGKIKEITPTQINLEEIVSDARLGFVAKPNALVSP